MKMFCSIVFICTAVSVEAQTHNFTANEVTPGRCLKFDFGLSAENASFYFGGQNKFPINQNYFESKIRLEYGLIKSLITTSSICTKNNKFQDGLFGLKYSLRLNFGFIFGTVYPLIGHIIPEIDFVFPLSNYDSESILSIGNRNRGLRTGSTFMLTCFRGWGLIEVYSGFNIFQNPVPNSFQLFAKIGRYFSPIHLEIKYELQKSIGDASYEDFSSYLSFRELPISYSRIGLEVKYASKPTWFISVNSNYLLTGQNVRRSVALQLRFVKLIIPKKV